MPNKEPALKKVVNLYIYLKEVFFPTYRLEEFLPWL
jgi:hypothetical protein